MKKLFFSRLFKITAPIFVFGFAFSFLTPSIVVEAKAAEEDKVIRVGWYETPLDKTDQFGRKVGYNYEYLTKVSAYANWTYEYVNGTWPQLMQKLVDGEIDLMTDVSYVEERTEFMNYSSLPMGVEDYYLFIPKDNKEYSQGDYTYFNDKKIGVNKGSIQITYFNEWAKKLGIHAELIEQSGSDSDTVEQLLRGEIDVYLGIDSYGGFDSIIPVVKVGASDFYFAVNKERQDLLNELEVAMEKIQDEDPFFNQKLYEKYYRATGANLFLSEAEQQWLDHHQTIKVGYQNNYLAYCSKDTSTGKLTGALNDFLVLASDSIANNHIEFEPICYETTEDAINGLKEGQVDCVFPINIGNYEAEQLGISVTKSVMSAEVSALVRKVDKNSFFQKQDITVAYVKNDLNYNSLLKDLFPDWYTRGFNTMEECLAAVSKGEADCFLISNYRYNNIISFCEKYELVSLETDENTEYSFAVNKNSKELYSILGRIINLVPSTSVNASLTYYYAEETHMSLGEFIVRNPLIIVVAALVVLALVLIIIAQTRMIVVKKQALIDALTGVKNRRAYFDAEEKMDKLIAGHNQPQFAITLFDVNGLKQVNDEQGHQAGDQYLRDACKIICDTFDHGPVYRFGGDEFVAISQGEDFEHLDELIEKLAAHNIKANSTQGIVIACGTAKYDGEESVAMVFEKADLKMYENKVYLKSLKQS